MGRPRVKLLHDLFRDETPEIQTSLKSILGNTVCLRRAAEIDVPLLIQRRWRRYNRNRPNVNNISRVSVKFLGNGKGMKDLMEGRENDFIVVFSICGIFSQASSTLPAFAPQ